MTAPKRLLIVDADPNTVSFLREKLDAANLAIRLAVGGEKAETILAEESFDLLLCALEMPHPHGMDVVARLRERGLETPVLFMTRLLHTQPEIQQRVGTLGSCEILDKPIVLNRLYERIESLLRAKIQWTERRIDPRFPVRVDLMLTIHGKTDTVVPIHTRTIDLSLGGLQFERKTCQICTGYERGGVHPDCILARVSTRPEGRPLVVTLVIPDAESMLLQAKVAWTLIEEGTTREFIGLRFESASERDRERLRQLCLQARPAPARPTD